MHFGALEIAYAKDTFYTFHSSYMTFKAYTNTS